MSNFDAKAYNNEYIKRNYDRINFTAPKGFKDKIQARSEELGYDNAGPYMRDLIQYDIENHVLDKESIQERMEQESREKQLRKLREKQEELERMIESVGQEIKRIGGGHN